MNRLGLLGILTLGVACADGIGPSLCQWRYTTYEVTVTRDSTGKTVSTTVPVDSVYECPNLWQ